MEKLGIEVTSKVILFGIKLTEGIEKRLSDDGKISLLEGITLLPVLKDVPGIISDRATLVAELKDLSTDELIQLRELISEELDIEGDKLEEIVDKGIAVVIAIKELLDAIKK